MLPDAIQLIIVTPVRELLREMVVEVQLPGADGYLGVLPGHAPLITELGIGALSYRTKGGERVRSDRDYPRLCGSFARPRDGAGGNRGAGFRNRCGARRSGAETRSGPHSFPCPGT